MTLALGPSTVFVLITLLIFTILFFFAWAPIERGRRPTLRPLRPIERFGEIIEQSAETGKSVQYSPGNGGLNDRAGTAETLSSLTSLASVSQVAARSKATLIVTSADSLSYLATDDVVQAEYARAGRYTDYVPTNVRYLTQQDPIAYAVGVSSIVGEKNTSGSVVLGSIDGEYLLIGERANRNGVAQIAGSSRVEALPLMIGSAGMDNTLLGEEMYAAPAYLGQQPSHIASLVAQDRVRFIIVVVILGGVIAASAGLVTNIGDYFLR